MPSPLNRFQDFARQLNEIDIGQAVKRLNELKLEDIKNAKLPSFREVASSTYFPIVAGLSLAVVTYFAALLPGWFNYTRAKQLAEQYTAETNRLPGLRGSVDNYTRRLTNINEELPKLSNLIATPDDLIYISKIFTQSAQRSNLVINGFTPIPYDQSQSCEVSSALSGSSQALPSDVPPPSGQTPKPPQAATDGGTNDQAPPQAEAPPAPPNLPPSQPGSPQPDPVRPPFRSNYYQLQLQGDYLNLLAFLRSSQEYSLMIIPTCLEVKGLLSQQASAQSDQLPLSNGQVSARLIVNIPTKDPGRPPIPPTPIP